MTDYSKPENRLTPTRSVRRFCLDCMGAHTKSPRYVSECTSEDCLLHGYRTGRGRITLKEIHIYCLHCHGWPLKDGQLDPDFKDGGQARAREESRNCSDTSCSLYPYRPGTKPYRDKRRGKGRPFTRDSVRKTASKTVSDNTRLMPRLPRPTAV